MKRNPWSTIGKISLLIVFAASVGLNIYTYVSMPNQIASYVLQHKSELKGDKGDRGDQGPEAPRQYVSPFVNNSSAAPTNNRISCTSNTLGTYEYTNCY